MQIGNLLPPRQSGFNNPQEGRIYSLDDVGPTIRNDSRYWILEVYDKDSGVQYKETAE
jgi:hypothetical protein